MELNEKSPPGWEGSVEAMKRHREIDNPFALAWWMKKKGYKSHKRRKRVSRKSFREFTDQKDTMETVSPPMQDDPATPQEPSAPWRQMNKSQEMRLGRGMAQAAGTPSVQLKSRFADLLGWSVSRLARTYLKSMGRKRFMQQCIAALRVLLDDPNITSPSEIDPQAGRVKFNTPYNAGMGPSNN